MRSVIAAVVLVLATLCSPVAQAWNCSDPSAERVDVGSTLPAGASAGDGDGQYYKGSDAVNPNDYYVCKVVTPATAPTGGNSNANSSSTSSATSSSQAASNSASQSSATGGKSSSTATGGTSSATGGNATGGNAVAGISNAGNSYSTNNNQSAGGSGGSATATGGNQKQTQSNALTNSGNSIASASGNGVGNGNNSNNYSNSTNVAAAAASPYAPPSFSTATCFKGFSGGASTAAAGISFGGGKIDQNCAELEAARQSPNLLTFCTQYIRVKYVKEAGVTLEMCMQPKPAVIAPVPAAVAQVAAQPIVVTIQQPAVVVPAPVVNVITPSPAPSIAVHAKPRVPRSNNKCVPRECPKTKPTVWNEDMVEGLRSKS
jgi:hypothetical protein